MEYRKMYEDDAARMDAETSHITLSDERKRAILTTLKKKDTPIHRFLEREITIPVKALIAGCAIVLVIVMAVFIPLLRVSERELDENRIIIIRQEGMI